jgi:C4-dicarboxylate transporter DctM subunit
MWAILTLMPLVLLLAGMPIFALLLFSALCAALLLGLGTDVLPVLLFGGLDSYPLVAIPLFILAGEIMGRGGIAKRLIAFVISFVGGIRGSLALTTIASSELFGTMSGSAVGCVAAVGRLMLPALRDGGYGERFAASLITASGAVAIVVPPSIAIILYGVTSQQSITSLFVAGVLPALFIGSLDAVYVLFYAWRHKVPIGSRFQWKVVVSSTKEASWALGTPVIIFGGIYGGMFTPTEAAGVAVVYSALVSRYAYKEVSWRELWQITLNAAEVIAQILIIVAAASVYSWFLTTSGLPNALLGVIAELHLTANQMLLVFNAVLLLIGSIVEPPAAILILTPIFAPVAQSMGINLVHFGIIIAVNLSIGMYTPPLGLNILAAHSLFDVPLRDLFVGVLPFVLLNLVALMAVTYMPFLSLSLLPH